MSEQAIQKRVIKYLESIGAYVFKIISANRAGIPDIVGCYKGLYFTIEMKTKKGVVSKLQLYNIEKVKQAGGIAFVARSLKEVLDMLPTGTE